MSRKANPQMTQMQPRFVRNNPFPSIFLWALCVLCGSILLASGCKRLPSSTQAPSTATAGINDPQLIAANNRGVGLMGKFDYEPARVIFQDLVTSHPDWLDVKINLAIATLNRQREGDDHAALQILDEILRSDPSNLRAHYCIGLLKLFLESPEVALSHFQAVANADPRDAYAAYYIGQCMAQSHKYEEALKWYLAAIELDGYLRSAYYAASQAYRAMGKDDEAKAMLEQFQKLDKNPRAHLAEFKYTRMGKKGEALAVNLANAAPMKKPEGPVFLDPVPLLDDGDKYAWKKSANDRPISITACDIDMDGDIDIFITDALDGTDGLFNAVCINKGDGHFVLDAYHVLAAIPEVNAALWGDVDNDGLTDVYLCRRGANMLWRQRPSPSGRGAGGEGAGAPDTRTDTTQPSPLTPLPKGEGNQWLDITAQAGVADDSFDTVDGAVFDADHDGDLDIFCVNADGPNELFNNNLNGTFRPIAQERGIAGSGKGSRQVLPVDLDGDRDLDIIVINNQPPHDVWVNDRMWQYRPVANMGALRTAAIARITGGDLDADGQFDLCTMRENENPLQWSTWQRDDSGEWIVVVRTNPPDWSRGPGFSELPFLIAMVAVSGLPEQNVLVAGNANAFVWDLGTKRTHVIMRRSKQLVRGWLSVALDNSTGASVLCLESGQSPLIWKPGPGRYPFATLQFTGRKEGESMRSNASGIGTHYAARIDSRWVVGDVLRNSSGPGQSLQPVAIGLGGEPQIDFVAIDWSDGVFQSEIDLKAGELHTITETQRQLSSCPVVFAWNGTKYEFITDVLGVGGIGYATAPGEYSPSRPWENLLLPVDSIQPRDGRYSIKLGEPMEEACYLDSVRLVCYDLPPGWKMTVDDRMNVSGPEPTGEPEFYREEILPAKVVNNRGEDVTAAVRDADLKAAPVGEVDQRFIGRLKNDHVMTLTIDRPIDEDVLSRDRLLVVNGWVEYPYSQTMFAAWQAGAAYNAPTIEARGRDGQWHVVLNQFGYPAGMPRQMSVPLENLPAGTTQLRITTNQEIYWDRIAIVLAEDCPQAVRRPITLASSHLSTPGFAHRTTGDLRQPYYDYDQRAPLWDTRHQAGFYTRFGAVDELLARKDDALAIFGPGEEIHLEFNASSLPQLPEGWSRRFVLELNGWCKDMDLYTKDGETIEPLPSSEHPSPASIQLHQQFNTRFESGR